ncbi:sugar O-acetyltransferase [Dellaglioa sp. L3N]
MDTEEIKKRMDSGEIYYENAAINQEQAQYTDWIFEYNQLLPSKSSEKQQLLKKFMGDVGEETILLQPLHANWGKNTFIGARVYANFNLTLVDDTQITIGDDTMIGPNVTLIAGTHPLNPALRLKNAQYNLPVTIGKNVWLGAGVTVLPGVIIGDNSVIGAGSLVTKDVPANQLAYGSPCQVIKAIS